MNNANTLRKADKREFIKISQAVGIGFVVMGAIGYVVKLSTCHGDRSGREAGWEKRWEACGRDTHANIWYCV